jgi:hypothetical protein
MHRGTQHKATSSMIKKGLNSLIILGAWVIWNHRNRCVFGHALPNMVEVLTWVGEARRLWTMTGARGLSYLMAAPSQEVSLLFFSLY